MTILLNGYWSQKRRLREKKSISQIAKLPDRHRVTIYREVKRDSVSQLKHDLTVYRAYRAQFAQDRSNEQKSAHGPALKIGSNHQLASQLSELIAGKLKHSPYAARQILIRNGIHCPFCSRTIYNYIDQGIIGIFPVIWFKGLGRNVKKSVHQRLFHNHTGAISIENRPEEFNRRRDLGHFEMDCVVGPRGSHVASVLKPSAPSHSKVARAAFNLFFFLQALLEKEKNIVLVVMESGDYALPT